MTLKNSFRKPFWGLFYQSLKQTIWFPLLVFVFQIIHTFQHSVRDFHREDIGFFWNASLDTSAFSLSFWLLPFAVLTAIMLFNFAWSKKQTNVLFSLGMSRSEIYGAKMLAGILPFVLLMSIAAGFEVMACLGVGYKLSIRYIGAVLFILTNIVMPYIMTFCVSSMIIANTANIIESGVFFALTMAAPSILNRLLSNFFCSYTLGASLEDVIAMTDSSAYNPGHWNWTAPFLNRHTVIFDNYYNHGEVLPFLNAESAQRLTVSEWSGVIMAVVYSVIAVVIGFMLFKRKKNEHAGTFGHTGIITEFCAVVTGIGVFYLSDVEVAFGEGSFADLLPNIPFFILAYFAFKLIFGFKKIKKFKKSLIAIPAYTAMIIVFFVGSYFGGLGYASYVPKAEDVKWVSVSTSFHKGLDDRFSDKDVDGFKEMNIRNIVDERVTNEFFAGIRSTLYYYEEIAYDTAYADQFTNSVVTYYDMEEIARVIDVHNAFVADGHINGRSEDTQGTSVVLTYRLHDGTFVHRNYFRTTEDTMLKLLELNDLQAVNNEIQLYFGSYDFSDEFDDVEEEPEIDEEYDMAIPEDEIAAELNKSNYLHTFFCYLFPTDMSKGFNIGHLDMELFEAIKQDLCEQDSREYYHHSAEDEIGIVTLMNDLYFSPYVDKSEALSNRLGAPYHTTSWNLNNPQAKSFVITKDMTNTVNYLKSHDLMKHFENDRTVDDISHVRLATLDELYGVDKKHLNIPLFYGSFRHDVVGKDETRFEKRDREEITNKADIQRLLDESVIFGYCSNESRIMEITYNDGSVATRLVR